uniref:Uncharacterized protein n=1 Tax=viral metagenome TaxID=1070528 RepID=A0A6C0CNR0_9ZZZZ
MNTEISEVIESLIENIENERNGDIKTIYLPEPKQSGRGKPKNSNKCHKPAKKRVVTNRNIWKNTLNMNDFDSGNQQHLFDEANHNTEDMKKRRLFQSEIKQKLLGYKYQDIEKKKYSPNEFVNMSHVLQLLQMTSDCFYCTEPVKLLYEISRDPKQWTLERIDNSLGHNVGNVVISCLSCNIKRRTMYFEKFRFTKQFKLVKDNSTNK